MTRETKARMIAFYEESLEQVDLMIELNNEDEDAVKSLFEEYKKLIQLLTEIRDTETID
jgi:hypothetical protein